VVDIPSDLREAIIQAQNRQVMVNLDQIADEVAVDADAGPRPNDEVP
jgi:hypothetical protein